MLANDQAVAIVVPVLNESASIEACLSSLLCQSNCTCEILVLDGGSTDGTLAILHEWQARHPNIHVHPNPARLQSAAVNAAAALAPGGITVFVRADAHAHYPPHFVRTCVDALHEHAATSVVVPMRTSAHGGFQVAVAAAQNSRLGNGGSAHRSAGVSRFVDHGHHAAFDRAFFRRIGGYDESFTHNEDAEHDIRAIAAGGRIWMCTEAAITYYPRSTLLGLARQYRNHGRGRARTLRRHGKRPRLRQMAPVAVLIANAVAIALMPLSAWFGLAPLAYVAMCVGWGCVAAVAARDIRLVGMGPAAIAMHLSWAWGFLGAYWKPVRKFAAV